MLWIFSGEEDMHQPALKRRRRRRSGGKATYSFCYENSCPLGYIWHQLISERGVENSVQGASFGKKQKTNKKNIVGLKCEISYFSIHRAFLIKTGAVHWGRQSFSPLPCRKCSDPRAVRVSDLAPSTSQSLSAQLNCLRPHWKPSPYVYEQRIKDTKKLALKRRGGLWLSHQTITSPLCAAEQWRCNKEFSPRTW